VPQAVWVHGVAVSLNGNDFTEYLFRFDGFIKGARRIPAKNEKKLRG